MLIKGGDLMNKEYTNFIERMHSFDMNIDEMDYEDELTHFGVKGMRWGVRKHKTTKSDTTAYNRRVPYSTLSNEELQTGITRMRLEDDYNRLAYNKMTKGKAFIESLSKNVGAVATVSIAVTTLMKNSATIQNGAKIATKYASSKIFGK